VSDILMPDMDGESLLRALRAVPGLEGVPFIALSAVRSEARIRAVVGAGADAFLLKPFPLRELTDKVRSLIERPQAARQIRGPLGEDMQPTRPVVRARIEHLLRCAAVHTGRAAARVATPPASPAPPADPGGRWRAATSAPEPWRPVRQCRPDPPAPQRARPAPGRAHGRSVRVLTSGRSSSDTAQRTRPLTPVRRGGPPSAETEARRIELGPKDAGLGFGRFTRVETRGRSFVVLTEAVAKPHFTVTTVITEKGVPLRKLETALPHPLAREEDAETVRRQLDLQHDEALRRLDDLVLDGARRRVLWSDQSRSVDAGLLAWTLSAVAQLAESQIGTEETARQLHLTRERALVAEDVVRAFQITPAARVVVDLDRGRELPRRAVRAVAGWCHDFATSALLVDDEQVGEPVRQATRLHADELERMGFYDRLRRRSRA
jgi:hypothetical protein